MIRRAAILIAALGLCACAARAPVLNRQAVIPAAPPRGEPAEYLNLPGSGLTSLFGKPAFVRTDGATQMWRYDGAACRAFFFLYGAPLAVRHVETLPHGVQSGWDGTCLIALRASPPKTS